MLKSKCFNLNLMQFSIWERIILANEERKKYIGNQKNAEKYSQQIFKESKKESQRISDDPILKYQ